MSSLRFWLLCAYISVTGLFVEQDAIWSLVIMCIVPLFMAGVLTYAFLRKQLND